VNRNVVYLAEYDIWSVLREKVYRSKIADNDVDELKTRLINEWAQFDQSIVDADISHSVVVLSVAAPDHKSGSAFKGQLYFQVGQRRDRRPRAIRRRREALRGWSLGCPHKGVCGLYPRKILQKSTFKSRVFCIFANWNGLICSVGKSISIRQ